MGLSWKRPDNIPFPSVWLKFQAKDLNSDDLVNYTVQDLPLERYEEAIDYLFTHFLVDEPKSKALGLSTDEESAIEIRGLYKLILNQNIVLGCFKEGSDEIIGLYMTVVTQKEDQKDKYVPFAEKLRIALRSNEIVDVNFDPFEHYNVDKYIGEFGLSVNSKYRGRRIGEYILRALIPLGKAIGVSLISGSFSAIASQKLAIRAGFECNYEMTYDDIAKVDPLCVFPGNEDTKSVKIMSMKI